MMPIQQADERIFARADFFMEEVTRTTDPVYWDPERIQEARAALRAASVQEPLRYEMALAAVENANYKACS